MTEQHTHPLIVGVSGGSCSGKTTLVHALIKRMGAHRISTVEHDSYYRNLSHLSPSQRARNNYDHPDALETTLLIDHLTSLIHRRPVKIPVYDFAHHTRHHTTTLVHPTEIIIVEGILIYAVPALREILDLKIYVDTESDIRLLRRLKRDVAERGRTTESVLHQYLATVRPSHILLVEPARVFADIIINGSSDNVTQIDDLASKLTDLLPVYRK